ncbi:C2H2-type zinc finger family protein [Raphanus sativus]|uniref:Zinc finger protein ZAT5 n=1 Tax=Raphanus sativus TaxID=3726 RepID=A0A6J0MV09_RAPSA|nr:zinc finger protein ZAT5 [Raphanus sativus]KAJ4908865.1 C2H2-type zinc finger family protein [Raphanus sativus]
MTSVHEETRLVLLIKGKRTKRQRSASPHMNAEAMSSVCNEERSLEAREEGADEIKFLGATDEDQDMANCLMLLSKGHKSKGSGDHLSTQKIGFLSDKKPVTPLGLGRDGVYQCKTCDKSFHSFQALGGHRTSHKKPKLGATILKCNEKKSAVSAVKTVEAARVVGSFLSLQVTSSDGSKKQEKTHECSICKAEFSSGQALGGHMRRHRGLTLNANANSTIKTATSSIHHQESIREKNFMELDLNLPAPEDEPKLVFASKDQILLFAAASNSLIDCHH